MNRLLKRVITSPPRPSSGRGWFEKLPRASQQQVLEVLREKKRGEIQHGFTQLAEIVLQEFGLPTSPKQVRVRLAELYRRLPECQNGKRSSRR